LKSTKALARAREYFFDIGTSGSTCLLQAVLSPHIFTKQRSTLTLKGGTHVPFSPTFHYISEILVPLLEKLGINVKASIERFGFYPMRGGKIRMEVFPSGDIHGLSLRERGDLRRIAGISGE
jgi:RNA 3'-terminal phosphate cyclase (ATP)